MESSVIARLTFATAQGSLFLCAIWALCLVFRRLPAMWKCWLWRAGSAKFLLALAVVVSLPVATSIAKPAPNTANRITHIVLDTVTRVDAPTTATPPVKSSPRRALQEPRPSTTGVVMWLWLAGVVIVLARDLEGWRRMRRLLHRSTGHPVTELPPATRSVLVRSGYWAAVRVKSLAELAAPALAGLFQPTLLLPADYDKSSPGALSCALAHELAHLRRRDLPWMWLAAAVRAIFWFNPLAWVAYGEVHCGRG